MARKVALLAVALAVVFAGCDATTVLTASPPDRSLPDPFGCTGYVVVGIWGQSNAQRGDRAHEVAADPSRLDVARVTDAGYAVVLRWEGDAGAGGVPFTWVHREDRDGPVTRVGGGPDRRYTAYVDLGNRLYERLGHCVVFVPDAFGGSAMQAAARPQSQADGRDKVWDPAHPNGLFEPALARLDAAVDHFAPALVFVYWSQGTRDALVVSPDLPPDNPDGATIEGWRAAFLRLADALHGHFVRRHPDVRPVEILLSVDVTPRCAPDDAAFLALHDAQRAAAAARPFVHVVSEVMPDPTTYPHYADGKHLRWSQYRYCENPAIADGLVNVLDPVPGWRPLHTCTQVASPPPGPCSGARGEGDDGE